MLDVVTTDTIVMILSGFQLQFWPTLITIWPQATWSKSPPCALSCFFEKAPLRNLKNICSILVLLRYFLLAFLFCFFLGNFLSCLQLHEIHICCCNIFLKVFCHQAISGCAGMACSSVMITSLLQIVNRLKDRLQSLLRIQSAHNKCGPRCPNFSFLKTFLNWNAHLYSINSIANPKSVRYSVSLIKFYKYSSSKSKQSVCLH